MHGVLRCVLGWACYARWLRCAAPCMRHDLSAPMYPVFTWCGVPCRARPCRWFGIPSYYVQQMFRQAQGTHYLATTVFTNPATEVGWALLGGGLACQRAAAVRFTV